MKILITGGTGFLGKATAFRLKSQGHEVTTLGRNQKAGDELEKQGVRFIKADLADKAALFKACAQQVVVIHCAALASPWGKYQKFYEANVTGTRHVLEAMKHQGVLRLVNLSTPSLYFDYQHRLNIKESDPLPPRQATHYSATKLVADQEVEAARKEGLETIGLRPRAIFGPGDRTVLGRLITMAETGSVPLIDGGNSYVDMTYIDNAVDAVVLAVNAPSSALGKTYNVTNGEPITSRAMIDGLCGELGIKVKYRAMPFWLAYVYAAAREGAANLLNSKTEPPVTKYTVGLMSKSQTLDITAARTELGYNPAVSLADGFHKYAEWYRTTK